MKHLTCLLLSATLVAAGCAAQEPDGRQREAADFETFREHSYREPGTDVFIVDDDIAVQGEERLRAFYNEHVRAPAEAGGVEARSSGLIVHRSGGRDAIWPPALRTQLSFCVSTTFGDRHGAVSAAMQAATEQAWARTAIVRFQHVPTEDGACDNANARVLFDGRPAPAGAPYLARAFFPGDARDLRTLFVAPDAFASPPFSLAGILRHELGHVLGFRHEHIRPEASPELGCREDDDWRALTSYDRYSVMHYPHCRGGNRGDLDLTQSDRQGAAGLYGCPSPARCMMMQCGLVEDECGGVECSCPTGYFCDLDRCSRQPLRPPHDDCPCGGRYPRCRICGPIFD